MGIGRGITRLILISKSLRGLVKRFTFGTFMTEINLSTNLDSWVLDIRCGSHVCIDIQGLKNSRLLAKGEIKLQVENGARVTALAAGTYYLSLYAGIVLE